LGLIDLAIAEGGRNVRILDLGCGQGHITSKIQENFQSAEISGLDYSISAIEYAVALFPQIDFAVGNAYDPPYSEGYFDIVVCNNLWEHVPDPLFLLKEIRRIIRSGGFLIISTPSRYRLENIVRVMRGKSVRFMSPLHVTEYSVGQIIEQLEFGKFEVIRIDSEPVITKNTTIKSLIINGVILPIIRVSLKITGSHHCLESTVFALAERSA
jgi:2-polyprenyl-3-methyl-5-hydroxy-6-metoxy-1,4-benzoquinol methylase